MPIFQKSWRKINRIREMLSTNVLKYSSKFEGYGELCTLKVVLCEEIIISSWMDKGTEYNKDDGSWPYH